MYKLRDRDAKRKKKKEKRKKSVNRETEGKWSPTGWFMFALR